MIILMIFNVLIMIILSILNNFKMICCVVVIPMIRLGDPVEIVVPTGACGNIACTFHCWLSWLQIVVNYHNFVMNCDDMLFSRIRGTLHGFAYKDGGCSHSQWYCSSHTSGEDYQSYICCCLSNNLHKNLWWSL